MSFGVLATAFFVRGESGEVVSSTLVGDVSRNTVRFVPGQTWFQQSGLIGLVFPGTFIVIVVTVWLALNLRCSRGTRTGQRIAWGLISLLALVGLVGSLTIGPFLLPPVLLLALGAVLISDGLTAVDGKGPVRSLSDAAGLAHKTQGDRPRVR
jgi:hypothetical protein